MPSIVEGLCPSHLPILETFNHMTLRGKTYTYSSMLKNIQASFTLKFSTLMRSFIFIPFSTSICEKEKFLAITEVRVTEFMIFFSIENNLALNPDPIESLYPGF